MPEGPEIRIASDEIGRALVGRVVTDIYFAFERLKPFERVLSGEKVSAVTARGKALLIRFVNGFNIYSHNQLYGKWIVQNTGADPATKRQLRLAIRTSDKAALLYSASDIEVLRDEELGTHPYLSKLGPDVLDEAVTAGLVIDRLLHKQFYRRQLGSLLLDQQFLAGVGNYLRSEVLFAARLHPSQRPVDCSLEQVRQLAEALIKLPRQSFLTRGITNNLQLVERLRQAGYSRSDYRFQVFDRAGEACYECGTPIVKLEVSGRRLYYCPECQEFEPQE
jgi:endonuclease-8